MRISKDAAKRHDTPPEALRQLVAFPLVSHRLVLLNEVTPGDVLHEGVTEYAGWDDNCESQVLVALHHNAQPETLTAIAESMHDICSAEELALSLNESSYGEAQSGPVHALVAVLLHSSTPEETRQMIRGDLMAMVPHFPPEVTSSLNRCVEDIDLIIDHHDALCGLAISETVEWWEALQKPHAQ